MPGLRGVTTPEQASLIERQVIERLKAYGRMKGISDPIVRDLLPNTDLAGGGDVGSGILWQQAVSGNMGYATVYSGKNPDDKAFVIYKVANVRNNPLTLAIRFWDGTGRTAIKDIWQVEDAWLEDDVQAEANVEDVIFYGVSEGYNIDFLGKVAGRDKVILFGKVIEPKGKTITPA